MLGPNTHNQLDARFRLVLQNAIYNIHRKPGSALEGPISRLAQLVAASLDVGNPVPRSESRRRIVGHHRGHERQPARLESSSKGWPSPIRTLRATAWRQRAWPFVPPFRTAPRPRQRSIRKEHTRLPFARKTTRGTPCAIRKRPYEGPHILRVMNEKWRCLNTTRPSELPKVIHNLLHAV